MMMMALIVFLAGLPARAASSLFSEENESSTNARRSQRTRNISRKLGDAVGKERRALSGGQFTKRGESSAQSTSHTLPYFQPALAGAGKFKEQFLSSVLGHDVVIVPQDSTKLASSATTTRVQKSRPKRSLRDNPTTDKHTLNGIPPKFRGAAIRD